MLLSLLKKNWVRKVVINNTIDMNVIIDSMTGTWVTTDTPEAKDIRVFYKDEEIINVEKLHLLGVGFKFKSGDKILNWRKIIEGDD